VRGRLLVAALALAAPQALGCTTHQCDPYTATFIGGEVLQTSGGVFYYETSPLADASAPWVNFSANETLVVEYPPGVQKQLEGLTYVDISPAVGVSDSPNDDASNFITGGGQIGLIHDISEPTNTGFTIMNTSCANYYVRVVVTYAAVESDAGEAGDAAAGPTDAAE
jgi:hypothetical protein